MGRRLWEVTAQFLVEAVKQPLGLPRRFTVVQHALPDDARVVDIRWAGRHHLILELESATWTGIDRHPLPQPLLQTVYDEKESAT
jgi:hypothetical protein